MPETPTRPARPSNLSRIFTKATVSLQKTLTAGDDDHGDISSWNPALGEGDCDAHTLTPAATSASKRLQNGKQMAVLDPRKNGEMGWRKYVKYFTPSWFTVTMGTGIFASLLNQFPYSARWLYWLSIVVFCLNIALYSFFLFVSILQAALFPQVWITLPDRPNQAFFLSAIPMSLGTIINMMVFVCVPAWGEWVIYLSWGFWMADAALSLICALYLPFLLIIKREEETPLSTITALQMFPVIGTVVASATAALVADVIPNNEQALVTIIIGYILLGVGLPTALFILVMYWQRLTIHKLPPREVIVSCFVPLGPMGMGSFALMKLGAAAMKVFPQTKTIHPLAGDLAYNFGVLFSLLLWGFALLWLFLAIATIWHCRGFPLNIGMWGFTFPIGTFALASNTLAKDIPSEFFRVVGSMVSVCVFLLWLLVAYATLRDMITGGKKLFKLPTRQVSKINDQMSNKLQDGEKLV